MNTPLPSLSVFNALKEGEWFPINKWWDMNAPADVKKKKRTMGQKKAYIKEMRFGFA